MTALTTTWGYDDLMTAARQRASELTLDERRRTSMARVGHPEHTKYLVDEYPDGTIVLTPAVTISAIELASLRDPTFHQALAESYDQSKLVRRQRPRRSER
jgi:hypothetical protein